MSQGAYVTLVGYVVQDPRISTTATGRQVAKVRVATTPRYKDDGTGQWRYVVLRRHVLEPARRACRVQPA
jgi:single-stranded DNA-binding protein